MPLLNATASAPLNVSPAPVVSTTGTRNGEQVLIPGFRVPVVDTTGAGDTFNGALAVALSKGMELEEACRYANAAAALSVTKLGAQTGMPTERELESFLAEKG